MKLQKTIIMILIFLLSASLIWSMIFWLPDVGAAAAQFIYGNSVTHALTSAYDDFFTPLICTFFSFANVVFAVCVLLKKHHVKKYPSAEAVETLTLYWVYTFVSAAALIVHCLSFIYIFSCLIAG